MGRKTKATQKKPMAFCVCVFAKNQPIRHVKYLHLTTATNHKRPSPVCARATQKQTREKRRPMFFRLKFRREIDGERTPTFLRAAPHTRARV